MTELSHVQEERERWAAEIADHLRQRRGVSVFEATWIDKGFLNGKWKMVTDRGPFFVKCYHPERYKFHLRPEKKAAIGQALQLQHRLHSAGVKCPDVYPHKEQWMQETSTGLHYAVLGWVDGHTVPAGEMKRDQLFELGRHTGKMHHWLRLHQPLDKGKLAWHPAPDAYFREWQRNWEQAKNAGDETVLTWLTGARRIVERLDLQMFAQCRPGWLHWDLWVDNIVVDRQGLAGIVDFDRMDAAYQEIDVARALLSGALRGGKLPADRVKAFLEGCREFGQDSADFLVRSIRMLYLLESIWWFRPEIRVKSRERALLQRFIDEMLWIERHWHALPDLLAAA